MADLLPELISDYADEGTVTADGTTTTEWVGRAFEHIHRLCLTATPITAITALAMPGDRERCLEAGTSAAVSKPMRLDELADLTRKLLRTDTVGP